MPPLNALDDGGGAHAGADAERDQRGAEVAPLKLARGIQNKVLEAMAMARPVVASVAAAEGIDHRGTIRVARDGADFVASVNALLADPVAAAALGKAARAHAIARYDWAAALAPLDPLIGL